MTDRLPFKGLSAVARPVDTFQAPTQQTGQGQGLKQLASALEGFNPKLQQFFASHANDMRKLDEAKGQYLFARSGNKAQFNAYLDQLKDSDPAQYEQLAGANPHLAIGWNKAWMESLSMVYSDDLGAAMASNPMVAGPDGREVSVFGSNDPGVVNQFLGDHLQQFMEKSGLDAMDPVDVAEVFMPKASAYQQNWVAQNSAERRQQMVQGRIEQVGIDTTLQLRDTLRSELYLTDSTAALQQLGQRLTETLRAAHDDGVRDRSKLNAEAIQVVSSLAKELGDPRLMDVLDSVETSPGNSLGKTADAVAARQSVSDYVFNRQVQLENLYHQRRERADKQFREKNLSNAFQKLMAAKNDPTLPVGQADIMPEVEALIANGQGHEAELLVQMQQRMMSAEDNIQNNPQTVYALSQMVQDGQVEISDIYSAHVAGEIDASTASRLTDDLNYANRYRADGMEDVVRENSRAVLQYITGSDEGIGENQEVSARGRSAVLTFRQNFRSAVQAAEEERGGQKLRPHELHNLADEIATKVMNSPRFRSIEGTAEYIPAAGPAERKEAAKAVGEKGNQSADYKTNLFFSKEDLARYAQQFNETGGGPLVGIAATLGITVNEFFASQSALIRSGGAQQ